MVRLSDEELARLDEMRPSVTPRAVYLRNLLREPPTDQGAADHRESLAILSEMARGGKVTAVIALEQARRDRHDDGSFDDDLSASSEIEFEFRSGPVIFDGGVRGVSDSVPRVDRQKTLPPSLWPRDERGWTEYEIENGAELLMPWLRARS
jgi:hypothetical protein